MAHAAVKKGSIGRKNTGSKVAIRRPKAAAGGCAHAPLVGGGHKGKAPLSNSHVNPTAPKRTGKSAHGKMHPKNHVEVKDYPAKRHVGFPGVKIVGPKG